MNVLHLSDVHYSESAHGWALPGRTTPFQGTLVDALLSARLPRVHALVVSGDITQRAAEAEFATAAGEIRRLALALGVGLEAVVVTPGNHDVDWNLSRVEGGNRFAPYRAFLRELYGDALGERLYPAAEKGFATVQPVRHVAFVSLSSCCFENHADHYGYVGQDQLERAARLLEPVRTHYKVAVLHHHLLPTALEGLPPDPAALGAEGARPLADGSLVRDAGRVLRAFEALGVDVVLHGHKHDPVRRKHIDVDGDGRGILLLGSGSSGVAYRELPPGRRHHAAVLELLPNAPVARVTDFYADNGQWTAAPRRAIWQAYDELSHLLAQARRRKLEKGGAALLDALREVAPAHTDWSGRRASDVDEVLRRKRYARAKRASAFWHLMTLGVVAPEGDDFAVTERFEDCIEDFVVTPRGAALLHALPRRG